MSLSKDKLFSNLKKLYQSSSKDESLIQWNNGLIDYYNDQTIVMPVIENKKNINRTFRPNNYSKNLGSLFDVSISAAKNRPTAFIDDFDSNISEFVKSISWIDETGKHTGNTISNLPALGFKSFSDQHAKDSSVDIYVNNLSSFLHDWFSKIDIKVQ